MDKETFRNSGFTYTPVETKRASEIVYDQIRDAIVNGELISGDKLPSERQLVEMYGRSHATIREALRMLESNGYITVAPGGRTTVKNISSQSAIQPLQDMVEFRKITINEITEFLSSVETSFVKIAIDKATPEQISELHASYDSMVSSKDDTLAFFDAILAFHTTLLKATNNELLRIIWASLSEKVRSIDEYEVLSSPLVASRDNRIELITLYRALIAAFYSHDSVSGIDIIKKCWEQADK